MRVPQVLLIGLLAFIVAAVACVVAGLAAGARQSAETQTVLNPFYQAPSVLPSNEGGYLIRSEPMGDLGWNLRNAVALRTLSVSAAPNGAPRVTGGMVIYPTTPSKQPRPVVAYAHGTLGFGDDCAPSRSQATPGLMPYVQTMIDRGWVVTATDYVGVGTAGEPLFLIGQSEAADVVNSVRVARSIPAANASSTYLVMGHSQGGHSALWTGELTKRIAPELDLIAVAATAPAAEIAPLLDQQWDTTVGWAIGPDVLVSWPQVYPKIDAKAVLTDFGQQNYVQLAYMCVQDAGLEGLLESWYGNQLFSENPSKAPGFAEAIAAQTPKPLPPSMPVLVGQSVYDGVVLPDTTALLQQRWCAAGSDLQTQWIGELATGTFAPQLTHAKTPLAAWPMVVYWLEQRLAGAPTTPNCGARPPTISAHRAS